MTTYELGSHERISIVSQSPELLELEAVYDPGGSSPPAHFHPAQDEHFEVLSGTVRVRTSTGGEHDLGAGETIDVPRGTVHQFWNPGTGTAVVRWQVRPALGTADFFRAIAGARTPLGKLVAVVRHRRE